MLIQSAYRFSFYPTATQRRQLVVEFGNARFLRWPQVYRDQGLKWEPIHSRTGPDGQRPYSFRIGQGFRAVAYRADGGWLRLLSLHPDHDSAYR